ncbi:MAG: hypothetical protein AAF447_06435 [Myxococcota bacterium]
MRPSRLPVVAWVVACAGSAGPAASSTPGTARTPPAADTPGPRDSGSDALGAACGSLESLDALTCVVAEGLRQGLPGMDVSWEPGTVSLSRPEGATARVSLDNLLVAMAHAGSEEAALGVLESFVASTVEAVAAGDRSIDPAEVRAVLKPLAWLRALPPDAPAPQTRPFGGELVVVYVRDLPRSLRLLGPGDLQELGLDGAGLDALARANLRAAFPGAPRLVPFAGLGAPLLRVDAEDGYAAARMLLPGRFAALAREAGGLHAAVPTRDLMLLARDDEAAAREALRVEAEQRFARGAYPVSPRVWRWTEAGFVPAD